MNRVTEQEVKVVLQVLETLVSCSGSGADDRSGQLEAGMRVDFVTVVGDAKRIFESLA